jgi:hypothetical protein
LSHPWSKNRTRGTGLQSQTSWILRDGSRIFERGGPLFQREDSTTITGYQREDSTLKMRHS